METPPSVALTAVQTAFYTVHRDHYISLLYVEHFLKRKCVRPQGRREPLVHASANAAGVIILIRKFKKNDKSVEHPPLKRCVLEILSLWETPRYVGIKYNIVKPPTTRPSASSATDCEKFISSFVNKIRRNRANISFVSCNILTLLERVDHM